MKKLTPLVVLAFLFLGCENSDSEVDELIDREPDIEAESIIYSLAPTGENIYDVKDKEIGIAKFSQIDHIVTLEITLTGMTPNTAKAVHIHNGTVTEPGRHWNQQSFYAFCDEPSLGLPWAKPFAGDVGNVQIDENGNGSFTIKTDLWALNSGDEKDILDKVVIVHQDPEDFVLECDPNHPHDHLHSNLKIGGGSISLVTDVERTIQSVMMTNFPDFTICK